MRMWIGAAARLLGLGVLLSPCVVRAVAPEKPVDTVVALAFSPDGQWVAGRTRAGALSVWERSTGRLAHAMRDVPPSEISGEDPVAIAFTPNSKVLASPGVDRSPGKPGSGRPVVHLWDPATGRLVLALPAPEVPPRDLLFLDHGATLAGLSKVDVILWDARTGKMKRRLHPTRLPSEDHLAASPDGHLLALVSANPEEEAGPVVWDPRTGATLVPPDEPWVKPVAFAPTAAVLTWKPPRTGTEIVDLATLALPPDAPPPVLSSILSYATAPKGKLLATATSDGVLRLWDRATLAPRGALPGFAGTATAMALSADGRWLASAGADGAVRLWDTREQRLVRGLAKASQAAIGKR